MKIQRTLAGVGFVLYLGVLYAIGGPQPAAQAPAAPPSLAEELRAADTEYQGTLEFILRQAEAQGDKAVKAEVEKRLATLPQQPAASGPLVERTLTITGNILGGVDFVMYPDGIGWADWDIKEPNRKNLLLLTLNDQVWTDWQTEKKPIVIERIVRWRVTNSPTSQLGISERVTAFFSTRGAGMKSIRLHSNSSIPFTLQIVYRTRASQPASALGSPTNVLAH